MRAAYDTHIARVGKNIYPILYVDDQCGLAVGRTMISLTSTSEGCSIA